MLIQVVELVVEMVVGIPENNQSLDQSSLLSGAQISPLKPLEPVYLVVLSNNLNHHTAAEQPELPQGRRIQR